MFVFICEVPTSGSTFSFNIVRGTLARRGRVHSAVSVEAHQLIRETSAHHVTVKNHDVDALIARVIGLQAFCQGNRFIDTI